MKYEFKEGCLWDGGGFDIETNVSVARLYGECRHCVGSVCPRVVIAYNEGGYNSTGVCLDCILEAEKTLTETR